MELNVENLVVSYGEVMAVQDVSFKVRDGDICAILGANGAGKSTILKAILGIQPARSGHVYYPAGHEITRLPAHSIHRLGIAWVPEGRGIYTTLTVFENLSIGAYSNNDPAAVRRGLERVFSLFPVLRDRQTQMGNALSGGEQQMLATARALMSDPKLVVLDEPSLGLAPKVVEALFRTIKEINKAGTSILMVEQNARQALNAANWAYLLEKGRFVREGPAAEMKLDEEVQRAYFGG